MPSIRLFDALLLCCAVQSALGSRVSQKSTLQVEVSSESWPGSCKSSDIADDVLANHGVSTLTDKVIVITGANGNIAQEVGTALGKRNASLILACRSPAKCEPTRAYIQSQRLISNGSLEIERLDLSDRADIAAFVKRVTDKHPKVDVLVNSAGTWADGVSKDGLSTLMEANLLGPALLTHLLLPALRGGNGRAPGRVVNVAAATYGLKLAGNTTAADLAALCKPSDPQANFGMSKFLLTHHALELAQREPEIAAFAVNPGVALPQGQMPTWVKQLIKTVGSTSLIYRLLPAGIQRFVKACSTNEKGLESCPQSLPQSASVTVAAAVWPGIESYSGSYLDFKTEPLPLDAQQVYGPFVQSDPTCVPRDPPPMEKSLRSEWYDEMLTLMGVASQ